MKAKISTDFTCVKTLESVYIGGQVEWFQDLVLTLVKGAVFIVRKGEKISELREEEDEVLCFTINGDEKDVTVVTAHKSGLVRIWECLTPEDPKIVRTFRSIHTGLICLLRLHHLESGSTVLATGGTEGSVKVWDLTSQYYTHNFRTSSNLCSCITFHPKKLLLYAGFSTGALLCWDLMKSSVVQNLEAHFSTVTGFCISNDGLQGVSCGRDSVCVVWDLVTHVKVSTVPVFSSVEGMYLLPDQNLRAVLATEKSLSIWDFSIPSKIKEENVETDIVSLRGENDVLHCSTVDHTLYSYSLPSIAVTGCTVGSHGEVLDLAMLGPTTHLAVACTSPSIRLYDPKTWQCTLANGHTDTILCLGTCPTDPNLLASGSKDNMVLIWRLQENFLQCLVRGSGHTEAVGGIAWGDQSSQLYSVSKDTTLKVWNIDMEDKKLSSLKTEIAHEKEINCVAVSPDGGLVLTGSQDKLAKVWNNELGLMCVLRGHTRGVWCARFSPVDRLVATGGADATIRMWSLGEESGVCVKVLEGNDTSVLRISWVGGNQLVNSSSSGLIKVWWVAKQECTSTVDMGEDKVWALDTHSEDGVLHITCGSAGGKIAVYKDTTEEQETKKQEEQDMIIVNHQKLSNLIQEKKWKNAVRLALKLSQPFTALKIFKKLDPDEIKEAVVGLDKPGLDQLLGYAVKWNTNTKHCAAAQAVLFAVLSNFDTDHLLELPGSPTWLQGLLPYTEKHFQRLTRLQTKSKFVPYILYQMKSTSIPSDSMVAEG